MLNKINNELNFHMELGFIVDHPRKSPRIIGRLPEVQEKHVLAINSII